MNMIKKTLKIKQAWFLIFRIKVKDHPVASFFIQLLFLLPIPILVPKIFVQLIPMRLFEDAPFSKKEVKQLIGAKGILVDVTTKHGDRIFIKSI